MIYFFRNGELCDIILQNIRKCCDKKCDHEKNSVHGTYVSKTKWKIVNSHAIFYKLHPRDRNWMHTSHLTQFADNLFLSFLKCTCRRHTYDNIFFVHRIDLYMLIYIYIADICSGFRKIYCFTKIPIILWKTNVNKSFVKRHKTFIKHHISL